MDAGAIIAVSAAVVATVELSIWVGLPDRWRPLIVIAVSGIAVLLWLGNQEAWHLVTGWLAVATSAAGAYGFTHAALTALTTQAAPKDDD
jgi:hypothetical protein